MSAIPEMQPPVIISDEPGEKFTNDQPVCCPNCGRNFGPARGLVGKAIGISHPVACPSCEFELQATRLSADLIAVLSEE